MVYLTNSRVAPFLKRASSTLEWPQRGDRQQIVRPRHAVIQRSLKHLTVIALHLKTTKFQIGLLTLDQVLDAIEVSNPIFFGEAFMQPERPNLLLPRFLNIDVDRTLRINPTRCYRD